MFARISIILISLQLCVATKHDTLTKTHQFPHKKLVLAEPSFDNATLYYALCKQPPEQCTIVQESNPFVKSTVTHKCDVSLEADSVQFLTGFNKEKVIIITQESNGKSTMLRTTMLHMPSCTIVDKELFEVPADWKGIQMYRKHMDVVVFKDGFEIVIKGLSQMCNTSDAEVYCSFGFDREGKRIEGPEVWPKTPFRGINISSPIIPDASGNRYLFINENVNLTGLQFNRDGGPLYVKLWGPMELHADHWSGGYSVANNANGMCYAENSTIRCWQHTLIDGHKMKKEFTFEHQHKTWNIYIHNLREGGFAVLMIFCPDRVCSGIEDQYYLMKIDAQGHMMGHVDISIKSQCNAKNGDILAKVYENEQGQYCAVRLCKSRSQGEARFDTDVNCYSDDYFSK